MILKLDNKTQTLNFIEKYVVYQVFKNACAGLAWTGAGENFSEDIGYNSQTGNIDEITREFGTFTYNHDDTDQLTGMAYSGTTPLPAELVNRTINHDYAGNRESDTLNGTTKSHSNVILENDKFKILPDEDGLGRIWQKVYKTENKTDIFNYQTDGKMIRFRRYENNVLTRDVRYYQDGFGRRVAKEFIINNQTWTNTFAYLGLNWQLLFGQNGQGERELFSDALGIDDHLGKINSGGAFAFTTDHLGTVANELNSNAKKSMSPYGESFTPEITPSVTTQAVTYGYTGRERDHESGLDSHRNRTSDPVLNLFLTEDPKGFEGGDPNIYRNFNNNVLVYTDPNGTVSVAGLFLAVIGGATIYVSVQAPSSVPIIVRGAGVATGGVAFLIGVANFALGAGTAEAPTFDPRIPFPNPNLPHGGGSPCR